MSLVASTPFVSNLLKPGAVPLTKPPGITSTLFGFESSTLRTSANFRRHRIDSIGKSGTIPLSASYFVSAIEKLAPSARFCGTSKNRSP